MRSRRIALALAAALGALYYARLRQPILTWGATAAEAASPLPGDELLEDADGDAPEELIAAALKAAR